MTKKAYFIVKYHLVENANFSYIDEKVEIKRYLTDNDIKMSDFIYDLVNKKVIKNRTELTENECLDYYLKEYETKISLWEKTNR